MEASICSLAVSCHVLPDCTAVQYMNTTGMITINKGHTVKVVVFK